MKTVSKIIALGVALILCVTGCNNFEELNTNPNGATSATSGMLATKMILPVISTTSGATRNKYLISIETFSNNLDIMYNRLGRSDLDNIATLRNVEKMVGLAPEGPLKNSYKALGHFIRANIFFTHTMRMGDIPYSEAVRGEENIFYPAYDTQKDVFIGILNELDEANRLFAEGVKFDGDPYSFGGNPVQWRKMINAFELRVLINLYKRAGDTPELRVPERLEQIASGRPLPESNADNYLLSWSDIHRYAFFKLADNGAQNRFVTSLIIDTLKLYNDRRLFYYANPTVAAVAQGIPVNSPDAYTGVDPIQPLSTVGIEANVSRLNQRYTERAEGEPSYFISYAEVNFILAEAAARRFINGNAKEYYEKGIRASMQFTAENTPVEPNFHHNMQITDSYINTYLQSPGVAFANAQDEQIHQIIIQKYINSFLRDAENPWFELRRTGYPAFPINPETNLNDPADKMPVRWMYPQAEYTYNGENVNAAVSRQFNGTDDSNGVMWILK